MGVGKAGVDQTGVGQMVPNRTYTTDRKVEHQVVLCLASFPGLGTKLFCAQPPPSNEEEGLVTTSAQPSDAVVWFINHTPPQKSIDCVIVSWGLS